MAHRISGVEAATALARKRAGRQFDPALSALLCADPEAIFDGLESARAWDAVISAEPALGVRLSGKQFDAALVAVADFVDLKSPYTLGHARAVADLIAVAGAHLQLAAGDLTMLRRAGLVAGLAAWACRTRSGTNAARWARVSGSACASSPI